jgi:DNA-binding NarL/FixJ family response regulator
MAIKLVIYDDNENLLNSIQTLLSLQKGIEILLAKNSAIDLIDDIEIHNPNVILMDIDMPEINGIDAVKKIRAVNQEVSIIMFTVFDDNDNIFNAICAGANGYLLKSNFDALPAALVDVTNGGSPMSSAIARRVLGLISQQKKTQPETDHNLSNRETELLEFIVQGYSYKMIAAELHISVETVRSHVKRIYKKLHVNNATGAVYEYNKTKKG